MIGRTNANSNLVKTYEEVLASGTGAKTITVDGKIKSIVVVREKISTLLTVYYNVDFYTDRAYLAKGSSTANMVIDWCNLDDSTLTEFFELIDESSFSLNLTWTNQSTCRVFVTYM